MEKFFKTETGALMYSPNGELEFFTNTNLIDGNFQIVTECCYNKYFILNCDTLKILGRAKKYNTAKGKLEKIKKK